MSTDVSLEPVPPVDRPRPRRRWLRWAGLAALVALLAVVALALWGALQARSLASSAREAKASQRALSADIRAQDWTKAGSDAARLADQVASARSAADSIPLRVAAILPGPGRNVRAVRTVVQALDDVSTNALGPLLQTLKDGPAAFAGPDGIDVGAVQGLAPRVVRAHAVLQQAARRVDRIDTAGLFGQVAAQVNSAGDSLDTLAGQSGTAAQALSVLPGMLGADGPRNYLLAFQNLAEARPTGGIFGAWAFVHADKGKLSLVQNGSDADLADLTLHDLRISPEAQQLYGADLTLVPNLNLSPDFPQAAQLLSQAWVQQGRPSPDSVVAIDPTVLAALLKSTGPAQVAGTTVTAENAVSLLMSTVYVNFAGDTPARKAYLGLVTQAVFEKLFATGTDYSALVRTATSGAVRGHLRMWSSDETVQGFLRSAGVDGALPPPSAGTVRVHVTNADGSKLDYYLHTELSSQCTTGSVQVVLTNSAPASVPAYVGRNLPDTRRSTAKGRVSGTVDPTTHLVTVAVYSNPAQPVQSVTANGKPVGVGTGTEKGWSVVRLPVELVAGAPVTLELRTAGRAASLATQPLVHTPTVRPARGCRP